jgi:hypothetical protein
MRAKTIASSVVPLLLLVFTVSPSLAAAKHFRLASDHFRDYATKAADLYFKAEVPEEKHLLSHLTSVSSIYAEKANTLANLVDVAEHMSAKRDRVYVGDRIQDFRRQNALSLPQDIKLLTDLVEAQGNQGIRSLGNLIINEMRVFARNVENL